MSATDNILGRIQAAGAVCSSALEALEHASGTRLMPRDQVTRMEAELRRARLALIKATAIANEPAAGEKPPLPLKRADVRLLDEGGADITPREATS